MVVMGYIGKEIIKEEFFLETKNLLSNANQIVKVRFVHIVVFFLLISFTMASLEI